jgi:hypothetical protein
MMITSQRFHARSANFHVKFAIPDLSVLEMEGAFRAVDAITVKRWALANRNALLDNWLRAKRGLPIIKLEGLN